LIYTLSNSDIQIFTIGHSTHSTEGFLSLLRQHSIEAVADVRSLPFSRFNPQFNREPLEQSLRNADIRYVFLGVELGARSEDPSCYLDGRVQYTRLAQTPLFQSGITRLLQGATRLRIALMCAEKEPLECHRTLLVAHALADHGVSVFHIHAGGQVESQMDAMGRLLNMTGIPNGDLFQSREELIACAVSRQQEIIAFVDQRMAAAKIHEE
jgi:uncharacterized protein (DUF488 family)